MVIDYVQGICNILDEYFSRAGYIVKCTHNGAEAIKLLKKEYFDLVLCEWACQGHMEVKLYRP